MITIAVIIFQEQYRFVHDGLAEALEVGDTRIPCHSFSSSYKAMRAKQKGVNSLYKQYQVSVMPAKSSQTLHTQVIHNTL